MSKVAAGDYPCWVYDPTGVNPPLFVKDDPSFVALLNAPLPSTAGPAAAVPTTTPPPVTIVVQAPPASSSVVGGTTQVPLGARFTKAPTVGASVAPVFVNKTPNVVGKR